MNGKMKKLDLLGKVCPVPLLETEKALKDLSPGERLHIVTDHTQAVRNIMEFLEDRSLEFEIEEPDPGIWKIKSFYREERGSCFEE